MEKPIKKTEEDAKPVGYGSSIQSSGYGNKNRPQEAVAPNQTSSPTDDLNKNKKKETDK